MVSPFHGLKTLREAQGRQQEVGVVNQRGREQRRRKGGQDEEEHGHNKKFTKMQNFKCTLAL